MIALKVLKFGGSSLATPECIRGVAAIVAKAESRARVVVVVSAFAGVTDLLLRAARRAERRDKSYRRILEELEQRHMVAARELAPQDERSALDAEVGRSLDELRELLDGASLVREASLRTVDSVLSHGERLSSAIVAAAFRRKGLAAAACDARHLIVTGAEFGAARVKEVESFERIRQHFEQPGPIQVVTGFIGSTEDGETTTLGRGGSDHTASLLGAALGAEVLELWTDVDGVMSADPRHVPDAVPLQKLSYDELMELSHFGAKVVYPASIHPARSHSIPLRIKNTFRPEAPGTLVRQGPVESLPGSPVRGIASVHPVALLRLEGDGMVGVPGIAMRLFGALAREQVSVILISQASSEHSICFAVAPVVVGAAARSIESEFAVERKAGLIDDLVIENEQAVVAAVGAGMREQPGIAGKLFGILGQQGVNVRAIAQGSSELNISLVVAGEDEARALNAIHDAFFVSGLRTAEVCVAGVGWVGGALLRQIAAQQATLEGERGIRLRLVGLVNRGGMILDPSGLEPTTAVEKLRNDADPVGLGAMMRFLTEGRQTLRVFVDCTASDTVSAHYERLLQAGVCVVTANKRRLAGPLADYRKLADAGPGRLYHETTVGAGLPVVRTLNDLIITGDRLRRIEGVLSGTLSFILNELASGRRFSEAVRRAHEKGYTEPDPREDLGGRDVARKLLILARLAGIDLEPEDVKVEPLLPADLWNDLSLDDFWSQLPELDEGFAARQSREAETKRKLCYLATLGGDAAGVALHAVEADHPCTGIAGSDNLIAFYTDRYSEAPLVVHGPGAGPDVTAAGVFADILRAVAESREG